MATPEEMAQTMIDNMPAKTGQSLAEWLDLLVAKGEMKHGEIVKFLKADHGVGHGFANLIAHTRLNPRAAGGDGLVEAQYAGAKADLRPIYDRLIEVVTAFGDDVEIAPKKTYVSLRRNKQFGLIQPSTRSRVDVGLNLKDETPTERLELSGSFNGMVSHRVRLSGVEEVDGPLVAWLREAYEGA
ncbi:MAG: DUF4287 domain-containing protein [Thermoanaerobaculia bacterium]|nr:DUF4287 domain-containing protein [Thermoanaerobaculia bacterium]